MGTRGAFGVIIGEEEKVGYNQFDSYPEGGGVENLRWLRESIAAGQLPEIRRLATAAKLVDEKDKPTFDEKAALLRVADFTVSEQDSDDWYCLTRQTHGEISKMLACGFILDSRDFPLDSLFCEWAYIVDLDNEVFEVYAGFQHEPHTDGRYANRETKKEGYAPCRLVASWPFDELPTDAEFELLFQEIDDDEEEED